MFTARAGLEEARIKPFTDALFAMDFENPEHRPILEMEGLKKWVCAKIGWLRLPQKRLQGPRYFLNLLAAASLGLPQTPSV